MSERVYNFSAGPAVLPEKVLRQIQSELLSLRGCGMSVLEISHRSGEFADILASAKENLSRLLQLPANYRILFLQGGSRLQFSMIPINLLRGSSVPAEYILTGSWGKKAYQEAVKEGLAQITWDGKESGYDRLPPGKIDVLPDAPYVHFTSNETIEGVQFSTEPASGTTPLVCDASSDFLHRPLRMERYGALYACAQKNAGPAGVTIVIVRDDLLERSDPSLPGYLSFQQHAENDSLFNTPPTFAVYAVDLVARWLLDDIGGLNSMLEINQQKATILYEVIDESETFYRGHAQPECRSVMNVTFRLPTKELETAFLKQAAQRRLMNLKGHRSVGGIRASIYNAMPISGVESLRDFMREFYRENRR